MSKSTVPVRKFIKDATSKSVEDIMVEAEYDGKNLVLDEVTLRALAQCDVTGQPKVSINTSGQLQTVEASAATSLLYQICDNYYGARLAPPSVAPITAQIPTALDQLYAHRLKKVVTLAAADAGGLVAATPLGLTCFIIAQAASSK